MDLGTLQQIIANARQGTEFSLDGSVFGSPPTPVNTLFNAVLRQPVLRLRAASVDTSGSPVTAEGTLTAAPRLAYAFLARFHVKASFTIDTSDTAQVHLTLTPPASQVAAWGLPDALPGYKNSLFAAFEWSNAQFGFDSQQAAELPSTFPTEYGFPANSESVVGGLQKGMSFQADITYEGSDAGLHWLLDQQAIHVEGPIEWDDDKPRMDLQSGRLSTLTLEKFTLPLDFHCVAVLLASMSPDGTTPTVHSLPLGILSGQLGLPSGSKPLTIPFYLELYSDPVGQIRVIGNFRQASQLGLQDVAKLLGVDSLDDQQSSDFPALHGLALKTVTLTVETAQKRLISASATVEYKPPGGSWEPFGSELLSFKGLDITFTMLGPFASPWFETSIECQVELAGGTLDAWISLPALDFGCVLEDGENHPIDLTEILDAITDHAFTRTTPTFKLLCTELKVLGNKTANMYRFQATVKDNWEFDAVGAKFALESIGFDITHRQGAPVPTTGQVVAQLSLATDFKIELSADYDDGDQGWQFEGIAEQKIHMDKLIEDLTDTFGTDKHIPATLSGLEFENLHVAFNTATKDFTFTGEAKFDVDEDPKHQVDIAVSIDIKHVLDGSVQKRFGGVIIFGDYEFDLVFSDADLKLAAAAKAGAEAAHVSTFLAAYRHTHGTAPGVRNLVKLISDDAQELVPDITTQSAFFAYQRQKSDTDTAAKWLFGINIEGGLNLSNIKLPDLPLLSAGSPPDLSLKLDLQIILAGKGDFSEAEIALIGDLNATDEFSLPDGDLKKGAVDLVTVLRMDGKVVPLNLPMKATGDGVQDDSSAATAKPTRSEAPVDAVSTDDDKGLTQWVKIQKHFGPLHVERLGLHYAGGELGVLLDAGISVSGLTVSFNGLEVSSPLTTFDPHFHLSGIGLDYKGDAVEMGGAFLKRGDAFSGLAVLRTEALALSAIGSYAKFHGEPSLFIYAVLDYPLGGPPFFFVTGMAAGFGYNRRVIEPPVEQVHSFPLVSEAIGGPAPLPADHEQAKQTLSAKLASLYNHIPPSLGDIFLAIGVKFTSFKLIDSFALMIAQFGERFELSVLGVSHFQLPSPEAGSTGSPLAEVFMDWKATYRPDEGLLGLKAVLAPGSYVFRPDCHLTGGYAYYAWMSGKHAGDFVYTVGGYHPDFKKPPHYPDVPRLGFNWVLNDLLHLKGNAYYALTGHALMAGGSLDASMAGGFDVGFAGVDFHAHLHIGADMLMTWEPFHYDAQVDLSLNIDISAHLLFFSKHFSLDVGADLHIWGPEFAGVAHVHLKVWRISHTLDVSFGGGAPRLRPITWDRFCKAFLPLDKNDALDTGAICSVSVQRGLIRTISDGDGEHWVINPKEFVLVTNSLIPIGDMGENISLVNDDGPKEFTPPAISPMGVSSSKLSSTHAIEITRVGAPEPVTKTDFKFIPVCKDVPASMWGQPKFENENNEFLAKPEVNVDSLVKNTLTGVEVCPARPPTPGEIHPVDRHELQYECDRVANAYSWSEIDVFQADSEYAMKDNIPVAEQAEQRAEQAEQLAEQREKTWQRVQDTVVQNQVRDSILDELELGREAIHFSRELSEYMRDVPLINATAVVPQPAKN